MKGIMTYSLPYTKNKQHGFTIVELLIVIVVVAILAAITIVAYNGIQQRAGRARLDSVATQLGKKIELYRVEHGTPPSSLSVVNIVNPDGITLNYWMGGNRYCLMAELNGAQPEYAGQGSEGKCGYLNASYYNNRTYTAPAAVTRPDKMINYNWGTNSPYPGINPDNFSIVWEGYITAPSTDTYTITYWQDDVMRIVLNNIEVVNDTVCCGWGSFSYSFTKDSRVPIRVEMNEGGGSAGAILHWSNTTTTETAIPYWAYSV